MCTTMTTLSRVSPSLRCNIRHHVYRVTPPRVPYRRRRDLRALDPDNATVLVAGGVGVGLETVKLLKDMGTWAYMIPTADLQRKVLEEMNVVAMKGDLLADVSKLMSTLKEIDGLEAVVSTTDAPETLRLIQAALETDVQRFVFLATEDATAQSIEEELKARSDRLAYVIVKVGSLITEPATDCGVFSEEPVSGVMHREDVAQLLVKALFSDKPKNKVLYAADKSKAKSLKNPEKELQLFEV